MLLLDQGVKMSRCAREKSKSGIYHIIIRGINRQSLFEDDEDREKLISILLRYKMICGYSIFAYCLMGNHLHLLLKIGSEPLEQIMRRIGASYVFWYNKKYERVGYLFQDRFRSEPVDNDAYFFTVIRYIHQNPQKAGIVNKISEYKWSSYNEYIEGKGLADSQYALAMLSEDYSVSLERFINISNLANDDKCLEVKDRKKINDDILKEILFRTFNIEAVMIQNEPRERIDLILREMLKIEGVSARQLARITGLSPNIVWKLKKQYPRPLA
jgi:putative transposase